MLYSFFIQGAHIYFSLPRRHGPDTTTDQDYLTDYLCEPPVDGACVHPCILSVTFQHCISEEGTEAFNAPIDIILWDFEGVVIFGNTWQASTSKQPGITVLAYGNPLTGTTKHASDVGSVYLNIQPNLLTGELPNVGLNLLDVADFYDVSLQSFIFWDS